MPMDFEDYVEDLGWLGEMGYDENINNKPEEPPSEDWLLEEEEEWPFD